MGLALSFFLDRAQALHQAAGEPGLVDLLGAPQRQRPSGTSSVMTDPLAVIASSPMVTGATSIVSDPMKTFRPITVRCFITPS
jgi:hypothetical protein